MSDRGLNQAAVGRILGVDRTQFNKTLHGKRQIQLPEVLKLATVLGVSPDDVLLHFGMPNLADSSKSVQMAYSVAGTGRATKVSGRVMVPRPGALPAGTVAARLSQTDGGMDGWVVFFVPAPRIEPEAIGRFSAVKLDDGGLTFRVPVRRGHAWELRSLCGEHVTPGVRIIAANPVLQIVP